MVVGRTGVGRGSVETTLGVEAPSPVGRVVATEAVSWTAVVVGDGTDVVVLSVVESEGTELIGTDGGAP